MAQKRGKHTAEKLGGHAVAKRHSPEFLRALARREAHIREARTDIVSFCEYVFERPDGRPAKLGKIHKEWHELADAYQRLMLIAPRHHWKTGMAQARTLYKLGRNVNELIKVLCQSDKKAIKRLSELRTHLKDNDSLHRVFPHLHIDRCIEINKHMVTFERQRSSPDPSIEALGITSAGTGDRATGLIADDVVDRRNSLTLPKVREAIKESWDDWMNLLGPDGWLFWICTLWHRSDLTHELMANDAYAVAKYEIVIKGGEFHSRVHLPDGTIREEPKPLWGAEDEGPFDQYGLGEKQRIFTPRQFARSFSNQPIADEEMAIDPSWIKYYRTPPPDDWPRVVILDLATSQSAEADYTGVVVLAINPEVPQIKVEDAFHDKLTFPGKERLVLDLHERIRPEFIAIELAAGGRELKEYMMSKYSLPLRGIKPHGANKAARLEYASPYLYNAIVTFAPHLRPKKNKEGDRGELISEILEHGLYPTDDILDAFTHGIRFVTTVYDVFYGARDKEIVFCPRCQHDAPREGKEGLWRCEKCGWEGEDYELLFEDDVSEESSEDDDSGQVLII